MNFNTIKNAKVPAAMLAAALSVSALAGCGNDNPEYEWGKPAIVYQHVYHEQYRTYVLVGKVLVPIQHPERFELGMRQCDRPEEAQADAEGCVNVAVDVDRQTYEQTSDGQEIILYER